MQQRCLSNFAKRKIAKKNKYFKFQAFLSYSYWISRESKHCQNDSMFPMRLNSTSKLSYLILGAKKSRKMCPHALSFEEIFDSSSPEKNARNAVFWSDGASELAAWLVSELVSQ